MSKDNNLSNNTNKSIFLAKTFKDYYDENSRFRKKHLAYMSESVECTCGATICRSFMSRHKKTKKHIKYTESEDTIKAEKTQAKILKMYKSQIPKVLDKAAIKKLINSLKSDIKS